MGIVAVIAPAILAENIDDYKTKVELAQGFASRIHIDICDGEFAPTFTVSENDLWWPAEMQADIHAMVARPSEHLAALVAKRPHMVIFHAEVQEDLTQTIQYLRQNGIKAGIALQRATVPTVFAPLIGIVDHVMIFTGDLGHYGGTASMMQLEKVRLIRAIRSDVEIGWDGGVSIDNAFSLKQGGVDVLNTGGAVMKNADPAAAYAKLTSEINKHGVI